MYEGRLFHILECASGSKNCESFLSQISLTSSGWSYKTYDHTFEVVLSLTIHDSSRSSVDWKHFSRVSLCKAGLEELSAKVRVECVCSKCYLALWAPTLFRYSSFSPSSTTRQNWLIIVVGVLFLYLLFTAKCVDIAIRVTTGQVNKLEAPPPSS